jgi:hypothetical protein
MVKVSLTCHSIKYFRIALTTAHFYPKRLYLVTSGYVVGLRHVSVTKVLFIKCVATVEVCTQTHTLLTRQWVLLSLCIKPLSPITLTPRRSRSIRIHLPQPPHLSRFHPRPVSSRLQPLLRPVVADRGVLLARLLASISAGCIAKSIAV